VDDVEVTITFWCGNGTMRPAPRGHVDTGEAEVQISAGGRIVSGVIPAGWTVDGSDVYCLACSEKRARAAEKRGER
jgi:hypothetical protein